MAALACSTDRSPSQSPDVAGDMEPPTAGPDARCPGPGLRSPYESGPPACLEPCWDWERIIDAANCSSRAVTDCGPSPLIPARTRVPLDRIASECRVGSYVYLRVEFSSGCATRLLVTRAQGPQPEDRAIADCVAAALSTKRWNCGSELMCSLWEIDTLP